jgi:DinB superfamily
MVDQRVADQSSTTLLDYDLSKNRARLLQFMQQTHDTLRHLLAPVNQETATTLRDARDGDKGWTALEVLCHLRDFDSLFRQRGVLMSEQEYPTLPRLDHEQLARDGNYNGQNLAQVIAEFTASRQQTLRFFAELPDALWPRAGVHPERGHFTMLDAALQIGMHDTIHIEQITRILYHNS